MAWLMGFAGQGVGGGGGWCYRASYPKLVYTPGYSCSSLEHLIIVISMLCDFLSHYEGELRGAGGRMDVKLKFIIFNVILYVFDVVFL